ncbi:ankyrin repeat-containing protein BDA1-like [Syzygium oleosum]|uniref:ankyrin repeat-containing protein BDA1-like n=1 Tax=Syzygium oleosum TaxID=219896 RepID=UPI0011D19643|nr:ankyrin repeat-containing protein BDA1-like [Syzygium oleosum]
MESELYEAALKGNVHSLLDLLRKDKLLLDRILTGNHTETPLHIAAMLGHLEFVEEVLARKPELAREQDSQRSTPLHLAAAKGYLKVVESLLGVSPEICFVRDKYKRNPLHVAAMKGHVDVLEILVRARPDAARSVVEHGQTILHLCVKHNRLETLKLLMDILGDEQFINSRDEYDDSILHLAAADRQTETIDFLINNGVNPDITNSRGFTAFSLLAQAESAGRASEIKLSVPQTLEKHDPSGRLGYASNTVTTFHPPVGEEDEKERKRKWQNSMHKTLMVVATLLATMSFQASISPPGGLWQDNVPGHENNTWHTVGYSNITLPGGPGQDDVPGNENNTWHTVGKSIMAYRYPYGYKLFLTCNTVSFVASLSIIILLISGLPLKQRRIITWIAMLIMWVAITFMAATYAISISTTYPISISGHQPEEEPLTFDGAITIGVLAWVVLMALLFLCHVVRLILKLVRKVQKWVRKASTERKPEDLMV